MRNNVFLPSSSKVTSAANRVRARLKLVALPCFALVLLSGSAPAQEINPPHPVSPTADSGGEAASHAPAERETLDQVIDRIVERQHLFIAEMRHFHPLVETYIQNLQNHGKHNTEPVSDQYFLGRLALTDRMTSPSLLNPPDFGQRILSSLTSLYELKFLPMGFAQMAILDDDFQRQYYDFRFRRREFLGEIRCLVLDVRPKKHSGNGRFLGKIWVEDQDYNIVRFEGTYTPRPRFGHYLHFDSWRLNLRPGLWFPAYIYSEESALHHGFGRKLGFKAQTRLWAYAPLHLERVEELTRIVVDSPSVNDQAGGPGEAAPAERASRWENEGAENEIERLQDAGLVAPRGDVEKILETVINNLLLTNRLEIKPEVHARVLLLSPLQSFTIGHTIVLSRGLLDVLPDEPSLAMIMAHELAHIILGHSLDTQFTSVDRLPFPDEDTFQRLDFIHTPGDEDDANKKGLDLLANSPYKDDLATAGMFLRTLQTSGPKLKSLIRPHPGYSLANGKYLSVSPLLSSASQIAGKPTSSIAALPLGSRIKLDPWSNRIDLMTTQPIAPAPAQWSAFQLTPFFPHLTRISSRDSDGIVSGSPLN